jgi:hypothetical protein
MVNKIYLWWNQIDYAKRKKIFDTLVSACDTFVAGFVVYLLIELESGNFVLDQALFLSALASAVRLVFKTIREAVQKKYLSDDSTSVQEQTLPPA